MTSSNSPKLISQSRPSTQATRVPCHIPKKNIIEIVLCVVGGGGVGCGCVWKGGGMLFLPTKNKYSLYFTVVNLLKCKFELIHRNMFQG